MRKIQRNCSFVSNLKENSFNRFQFISYTSLYKNFSTFSDSIGFSLEKERESGKGEISDTLILFLHFPFISNSFNACRWTFVSVRHILILFVFAPICPLGFCRGRESLQNLCEQIPGDALLYSMFKENAEPVRCPLKGASRIISSVLISKLNDHFH